VWLVRRRGEVLRWLIATCFLGVAVVGASVAADLFFAPRVAVVVPAAVDVLAGPAVDAVLRFELHAGAEVRLVEERSGWLRVELPDGQQGWLPLEAADVVRGWRG
jgi:SH3-like domain-containing protein